MAIESVSVTRDRSDAVDRANTLIHQMAGLAGLLRSAAHSNDHPSDVELGASADLLGDMLTELHGHVAHLAREH